MEEIQAFPEVRTQGAKTLANYLMAEMVSGKLRQGVKLPPERELGERFGLSRGSVRRVLAQFRDQGLIGQRVGSGTFVLAKAETLLQPQETAVAISTSPAELMVARLLIEPLMPGLIVQNATSADFKQMFHCLGQSEAAVGIDDFEHWDEELHKAFAFATHNSFFVQLMDLTNKVREQGEWGRLKRISLTPETRQQYELQHRAIVEALKDRDASLARNLLLGHLQLIQQNLFGG
ncbi:GntR family transcriptional regulator [Pollutimonas subterranea]|uniref:GntR family transcriptional regulator n=1 Tax=Pollutimonas subterranea TaxID=2045210 RepID=A0A2N4U0U5_9BURK|nr:FCD domain-containing protein [Pollutimonas subterranea]PLC48639.1 GntR family transcriptional regulator [Pollutimonas subterranea]